MAPWGKVHASMHNAYDRVKSGLAYANHKYQQGLSLAGKVNDLYQVGNASLAYLCLLSIVSLLV